MAQVTSATVSGNILTIIYDEAMTYKSSGGVFSSSGTALGVTGFTGDNTNTWRLTLSASIATTDYIVMVSDGMNSQGTTSEMYLGNGTAFVGGTGTTVMELTEGGDNYQSPFSFFGNNGSDTISVPSWGADFISLYETTAASDTVSFGDQWSENPLQDVDLISGFDVRGTATNDKLNLLSRTIAAPVTNVNGTDVGAIASHSITGGIVTFKDAGGIALVIGIDTEIEDAYQYLETNIAPAGTTLAFQGNGIIDGLVVFQKGATGARSFMTALDGISGVTLGNTAGINVVQIVDTTAPMVQNAAMTSTGIAMYFSENVNVTAVNTTGIKLYKNGTIDMGAPLTKGGSGATVTLASTNATTLAATDFVVLDTTATTGANTASDGVNAGVYLEPFKMAFGGAGNNTINLAPLSVNFANGGAGDDSITGTTGDDELDGENGNDILSGGAGDDDLSGGAGNDSLDGGTGNDYMEGDAGNDTYVVRDAGDNYWENDANIFTGGNDTVQTYLADTSLNWNIENIRIMSAGAANAHGNDLDNTVYAGAGNNVMDGGWNGIDTLSYATATAGVKMNLALATVQATVGSGSDTISGFENLAGSTYNDTLTGNTGANTINGGKGNDTINGGAGDDMLIGGLGADTLSYATATALVKVNLAVTTAQFTGEAGLDTISGFENLIGSSYNDILTGNTGANTITGGAGNDLLLGGLGGDMLNGEAGNDTLSGGAGKDFFLFNKTLNAATNKDTITDFVAIDDTIKLENTLIFAQLITPGTLSAANFRANLTGTASDTNDYILYDTDSGALYYDADGSGSGARIQFATLGATTHPTITNADFVVY